MMGSPLAGDSMFVGRKHQGACFHLGFERKGHMYSHLITVEVSVKCSAD